MGKEDLLDAARNGDISLVGKLLDQITKRTGPLSIFPRSVNINGQDVNGYTPLHHACLNGHSNVVRLLLAHNAIPDMPDIRGSTPLYLAAWAGHQEIVKMLLLHLPKPSNPNAQTIENETPLHCASQHGHNTALAILLAFGADPTIRNNSFRTALDLAAEFGRLQAVQILIRTHPELLLPFKTHETDDIAKEPPTSPCSYIPTPTTHIFTHTCLHLASRNGHKKVVEILLNAGVNPNILTHAGSALHEAALCGKKSVVAILLKAGVDPNATDGNGRTALDILKDYPPHVTYEIASVINDFCHQTDYAPYFKPIVSNEVAAFTANGSDGSRPTDIHTMPKSMHAGGTKHGSVPKSNRHLMPKPTKTVGLSISMSSLEQPAVRSECYLPMKPILWQKSATDIGPRKEEPDALVYKPVYKQPYISSITTPWRQHNQVANIKIVAHSVEAPTSDEIEHSADPAHPTEAATPTPSRAYHCVDEYVQMSEPSLAGEASGRSTPKTPLSTPIPSPRFIDSGDYVNINTLTKQSSKAKEDKHIAVDHIKNSKEHSPTPELPPPSVSQAERTIFEFMQPFGSSNKRRSMRIDERLDFNLETLVEEAMDFNGTSDSSQLSLRNSDCVEEYVGDEPFAGLFKGSTLNLANDEVDSKGLERKSSYRLRSPSLVRSIKPIPSKKPLSQDSNSSPLDDFNESKVWEEINSILESIGNEMLNDDKPDVAIASEIHLGSGDMPPKRLVQIRNPTDLLLGISTNPTANWCHSTNTLIYGQILYEVYYLGSTVIKELHGTMSTRKSIQKLKRDELPADLDQENCLVKDCKSSTKFLKATNQQARLKVGISLSHAGVKFVDTDNKGTICIHDIENINCVCQDAEDLRYFAYITKESDMHYCHVFMVDCVELATEIILTLGQAFEVAYQLALSANVANECIQAVH